MATSNKEAPQDFVNRMLVEAIEKGASDVYWLPSASRMNVRLRRDGIQENIAEVERGYGEQCVARIKVLSGLLTYRTQTAQDGAIRDLAGTRGSEMRVSVMPSSHGERASIRILQNEKGPLYLSDLGFSPGANKALQEMLDRPAGMIVLTGPTGSGKTTTIYALVRELLKRDQDPASIITIEDPIECEIDGITQTAVSDDSDWGYAAALRAALRQDVKTLIVGEMRDKEVVKVTLDAALTGHRVITTYHAGDIPSVYARMLHQGFEPFLVASAITGVVNQRLVASADSRGRIPVVATLTPSAAWRDFVASNPGLSEFRKKITEFPSGDLSAVAEGMAKAGLISEDEYRRLSADG